MEKKTYFKITLFRSLFGIAISVTLYSCTVHLIVPATKLATIKSDSIKNTVNDADINFMSEAAEINLKEIRLSEVALERSKRIEIRELGKKLTNQHYQSLLDLTALASRKNITIPTKLGDKENVDYEKLNQMTGEALDHEYVLMMIEEHKEAIVLFEKEAVGASDPDIRQWAAVTLSEMHTHLDYAIDCRGKLSVSKDSIGH